MKRLFMVLLVTITLLTAAGCGSTNQEDNLAQNQWKLIVDGNEIDCRGYLKFHESEQGAELPVIAIMKALGADVKWLDKSIALITYQSKEYLLDTSYNSLIERGKSWNYILPPPGSPTGCYEFDGKEYVVGNNSFGEFLRAIDVELTIDYYDLVVYIESSQ